MYNVSRSAVALTVFVGDFEHNQCVQHHTLGWDSWGFWILRGASLFCSCHSSLPERQVPTEHRKEGDEHLSPLRRGRGHGPAHARVLSGMGNPPPCSVTRNWRELGPLVSRRCDAEVFLAVRSYCEEIMLPKKRAEWETISTSHPCKVSCRSRWS